MMLMRDERDEVMRGLPAPSALHLSWGSVERGLVDCPAQDAKARYYVDELASLLILTCTNAST